MRPSASVVLIFTVIWRDRLRLQCCLSWTHYHVFSIWKRRTVWKRITRDDCRQRQKRILWQGYVLHCCQMYSHFVFCFYVSQTSKLAFGCSDAAALLHTSSAMLHLDLPHEDREPELPRVGLTRKDELQADCWLWVCLKFPLDWTVYLMCTCKGWTWFCDQRELYDIHRSPITWPALAISGAKATAFLSRDFWWLIGADKLRSTLAARSSFWAFADEFQFCL